MDNLKNTKLKFCNDMALLLERLDTETAEAFMQWLIHRLIHVRLEDACHFELWSEEAEFIGCME